MEHKLEKATFSKDIKNRVRALQERDNWRNLFTIAFDWLVIIGAIALVQTFPMWWVYLISIAIIGSRMRAFDNLMHEASHFQLFKNKILNKWIACFFVAFPVFTSFTAYCQSHYLHHRHLWHEQKDPDTKRYALMGLDKPQDDIRSFILRHVLKPLTLTHVPKYIYGTIKVNILTKEEPISEKVAKSLFWPVIVLLSVVFDFWLELFLFWFIPLLTTFQIIRYWAEMAEHSGLKNTHELYSSRNTFGNPIQRFFLHPHHDNYHLVHHLFPAVPHYRLKKAHTILMENESYREAHHCTGFFKSFLPGFYSVIQDICGLRFRENRPTKKAE
ncbi:fatty acid desaturase [Shouchella clausii]|jgi:fatty acid desaturase|uniref:fatty acid desaturase family protein n=1 Tax=Shouchella TaxID=2893057 RepID=UPI000791607B|nr:MULTISPECIES: fatty acid desaturase family protein [Shouchella]KKI86718.1 fatty acid desaturase [Shouchella clausii]MDO7266936.1 fatty acid desaturase family protein [Shouchella clausii]MDO7284945.1 fatty acid desaturase family protein [Shouchella clausii]MDO7286149.1 fatty acid desaturase family protein [Shouchella clausii]MDO7305187.1 fatty acid desaturase family protein [Shouchella clausii]